MRVFVGGVRGSTPASGAQFVRYGGHTSSIGIAHNGELPTLVLDAGTGLQRLSSLFDGRPFSGTILLGHLHWDHTQGLPFFPAGDRPDARVQVLMPAQGDPLEVLRRSLSPPHFSIDATELLGRWSFGGIEPGLHRIEGFDVVAREIPHKGGRTFGYRVDEGHASVAYLSDHSAIASGPGRDGLGAYDPALLELAQSVDLLIHDAQHTREQFATLSHYGHSTIDYAVGFARAAGARRLLLFHHDPNRTDDELDAIAAAHRQDGIPVEAAAEGTLIELG